MRSISKNIVALSVCLMPFVLEASLRPEAMPPAVEAHLAKGHSHDALAHVHVSLKRPDVAEVKVELFDADGKSILTHLMQPRKGDRYRTELTVSFAPAISAKVQTARITGFTIRSTKEREELFDTRLRAVPVSSCAGQCSPTRIECNNSCFCFSCGSATYSCVDTGGGCEASCVCNDCGEYICW